jgi:glyoxylase-like metal-dependent hydrolase (beta-lactamase superfamily II)
VALGPGGRLVCPAVRAIDVRHLGREKVICCWEVDAALIDPGPQSAEATLLDALEEPPRAILLTHIHLDHAGATGSLVRRWPELPVYVHELGAPHLIDPSKLLASASRLYPDLEERWGSLVPVPDENIHVIGEGDRVRGDYRVAYTPGHASHHVSYLHEPTGTAFVGDTMGVRVAPARFTLMPTPPPDIDVEAWRASIETVRAWRPDACAITHFGAFEDVDALAADALEELEACASAARDRDQDAFLEWYARHLADLVPDEQNRELLEQASPPGLEYLGLERYWRKLGSERHAA